MVSKRIVIYIPLILFLYTGFYFWGFYLITIPLLIYGITKIITRSCWRKYFTFLFAAGLNYVLFLDIHGYSIIAILLVLMVLEVF